MSGSGIIRLEGAPEKADALLLSRMKINPIIFVFVVTSAITLAGCPSNKSDDAPYGQTAPPAAPPQAQPPALPPGSMATDDTPPGNAPPPGPPMTSEQPGAMGGPMMGGGDPMAPLTATPELDTAIKAAEGKSDKKAIAAAYAKRGYARMTDDNAGQRIKYRMALEDFRVALQNDPYNAQAKQSKATIEEIYTSMGRPIPGTEPPGPPK